MMRPLRALVGLTLILGLVGNTRAATALDEALKLMQRGEYLQALAELKPIANQGNAEAQFQLGQIYERGLGIIPDDYWAQHWYRLAAEQGHPAAAGSLAGMAARLQGGDATAVASESGEGGAEGVGLKSELQPGVMGADVGLKPDLQPDLPADGQPEAETPAAAAAESDGLDELPAETQAETLPQPEEAVVAAAPGSRPANALGLPDVVRPALPKVDRYGYQLPAEKTVQLAVGPGEQAAMALAASRGLRVHFDPSVPVPAPRGDDVTALPTGDGPSDAPPAPPSFIAAPTAASGSTRPSDPTAAMTPASEPETLAPSPTTLPALPTADVAADLSTLDGPALKAAAESGNPAAQRELAQRLHQGERGERRDLKQALVWYQKAAEQGDAAAQFHLGNLYLMGEGVGRDDAWAITWFRRAAAQGHVAAQSNLDNLLRLEASKP